MRLTRFFLRYFPPGLCIEFKRSSGKIECKEIDLLNLSPDTNIDAIVVNLIQREPLLSMNRKPKLVRLIGILVQKQREGRANRKSFTFKKALKAHQMPMTNFCCNKTGQYVVTASYDKTARILMPFQTQRDSETSHVSLSGHQNVVYAVAFNPFTGTRVATGSFDKTAKIWKTKTGELLHTLRGHDGEIVTLEFAPVGSRLCTGAMDGTAKLWDTKVGREVGNLCHDAEVSSVSHNYTGTHLVTGACDNKVMIWDVNNGKLTRRLEGHTGEISNVQFNHESNMILSSSADHTAKLWDAGSGKPIFTFDGHKGELMDAVFNTTGSTGQNTVQ
jgi:dynein assembly factor with WDR repeat domains 1